MNEIFLFLGQKPSLKIRIVLSERKVPRDSRHLQLKCHAFKRGLLLVAASCLLPPDYFVAYPLGVL